MAGSQFTVDVFHTGDAIIVAPVGELDLATVSQLRDELARQASVALLVLDLRGVTFMDSSGLALVVEQQHRAEADGSDFRVVPGSGAVRRLLEVTGVARHLRWAEAGMPQVETGAAREGRLKAPPAGAAARAPQLGAPERE